MTEAPASAPDDDLSYEAWLAYRRGNKQRTGAKNPPRSSSKSSGKKPKPGKRAQEKNGFNRRTGGRNRCYRRGSEYHLLPKCPTRQETKAPAPPSAPPSLPRSPFSTITSEDAPSERKSVEHSFTTSLKVGCPTFYAKNGHWGPGQFGVLPMVTPP